MTALIHKKENNADNDDTHNTADLSNTKEVCWKKQQCLAGYRLSSCRVYSSLREHHQEFAAAAAYLLMQC